MSTEPLKIKEGEDEKPEDAVLVVEEQPLPGVYITDYRTTTAAGSSSVVSASSSSSSSASAARAGAESGGATALPMMGLMGDEEPVVGPAGSREGADANTAPASPHVDTTDAAAAQPAGGADSTAMLTDAEWRVSAACRDVTHLKRSNAELETFAADAADAAEADNLRAVAAENEGVIARKIAEVHRIARECTGAGFAVRWHLLPHAPQGFEVDGFPPQNTHAGGAPAADTGMIL
jgi:hypothetical protein